MLRSKILPTYSVAIRTLGKAGEKYRRTLQSIAAQSHKPEEVIIVIPQGYDLPKERLGYERFVIGDKGMVAQRARCFAESTSQWTLAIDDDVEMEPTLIEQLLHIAQSKDSNIITPSVRTIGEHLCETAQRNLCGGVNCYYPTFYNG